MVASSLWARTAADGAAAGIQDIVMAAVGGNFRSGGKLPLTAGTKKAGITVVDYRNVDRSLVVTGRSMPNADMIGHRSGRGHLADTAHHHRGAAAVIQHHGIVGTEGLHLQSHAVKIFAFAVHRQQDQRAPGRIQTNRRASFAIIVGRNISVVHISGLHNTILNQQLNVAAHNVSNAGAIDIGLKMASDKTTS